MPGVLCGYIPTPQDAYLFAQINDGNAVSLPLGEEYTWAGAENMEKTIARLFSEPFGQGYPKGEAARKLEDTRLLKRIRKTSQVKMTDLIRNLERPLVDKVFSKTDVIEYILRNGNDEELSALIREMTNG